MLYCPQCGAEYREGISSCSDCHVLLVRDKLERDFSQESVHEPGDPNEDPFCKFWVGNDDRVLSELQSVLDEAQIPHKTVRREDWLLNRLDHARLNLGVPASVYERAEQAVGDAFSSQPLLRDTDGLIPESLQKKLDFDQDEPSMELPDFGLQPERTKSRSSDLLGEWYPEDATSQVWNGDDPNTKDMIEMSLHENEIHTRWETQGKLFEVFVLPEDETRAREIIREIVESTPME